MFRKPVWSLIFILLFVLLPSPTLAQKSCFTLEAREHAERTARVFAEPDPGRARATIRSLDIIRRSVLE